MGKNKARKTRWRTLPIADDQSDSEDSNSNSGPRSTKDYQQRSYHTKYTYSSQSTPRRRYQYDSVKSTRSSSTVSENKITFNEDEYTKITTPRQDVLFKKGYLNKPKSYHTQNSTGTSIISTDNSTGNGTPDHQSADLEYESQFMFPNGFVDQNGIYYINSYEPYPLMLYNPPTYYQECSNYKSKRYSTGSLTESTSPNNEEATSQDMSGGEAPSNVSDYGAHHVYNMIVPGYYVNGVCPSEDVAEGQNMPEPQKKLKKRRRRKTSRSQSAQDDSSEYTDDNEDITTQINTNHVEEVVSEATPKEPETDKVPQESQTEESAVHTGDTEPKTEQTESEQVEPAVDSLKPQKYDLKPDAEEFVPRAFRNHENLPMNAVPIKLFPPNFVPIPLVPLPDYNAPNFNQAFIPPGIPVNFVHHNPKMYPNYVNYIPNQLNLAPVQNYEENLEEQPVETEETHDVTTVPVQNGIADENVQKKKNVIDIATIVSKLEEAAKEQDEKVVQDKPEAETTNGRTTTRHVYRTKNNTFRKPHFGKPRQYVQYNGDQSSRSSVENGKEENHNSQVSDVTATNKTPNGVNNHVEEKQHVRNSPGRKNWKQNQYQNGSPRRFQQYFNRSNTNSPVRTFEKSTERNYKSKQQSSKNYSEMLKKTSTYNQNGHDDGYVKQNCHENVVKTSSSIAMKTISLTEPQIVKAKPNQWIPVSNKKKRRNRNAEESLTTPDDVWEKEQEPSSDDIFESYDVNLLEDVVPPPKTQETEDVKVIEDILTSFVQIEPANQEHAPETVKMIEVTEIEKEIMVKLEETKSSQQEIEETVEEIVVSLPEIKIEEMEETVPNEKPKPKKKSKKGTQKPVTKRVIITDIDLSQKVEAKAPTPVKKIETKKPDEENEVKIEEKSEIKEDVEVKKEETIPVETSEKKPKKKKKKPSKTATTVTQDSSSSSNATLSAQDDSYDFLLDGSILNESVEKTNDEVSQELDKIIQKGMYNSLEVKIKSLNVDDNGAFFRNFLGTVSNAQQRKTPDFNRIFQSTRHLLKPNSVSVEEPANVHVDLTKITLPDLDSSAADRKTGVFLEKRDATAILDGAPETNTQTNEDANKTYPITQAVKEWMSKTREATPEIEILKSPSTIYMEFCNDTEVASDGAENSLKEDEEVTVFSVSREASVEQQDLLEYWENELETVEICETAAMTDGVTVDDCCEKCRESGHVTAEDALDVYESKYGQNEDYLKLQQEISQKTKNNPRSGSLPHRAICCTLQ